MTTTQRQIAHVGVLLFVFAICVAVALCVETKHQAQQAPEIPMVQTAVSLLPAPVAPYDFLYIHPDADADIAAWQQAGRKPPPGWTIVSNSATGKFAPTCSYLAPGEKGFGDWHIRDSAAEAALVAWRVQFIWDAMDRQASAWKLVSQ